MREQYVQYASLRTIMNTVVAVNETSRQNCFMFKMLEIRTRAPRVSTETLLIEMRPVCKGSRKRYRFGLCDFRGRQWLTWKGVG